EKNIPIASGIGGGSADAAAVLHALAKQWKAMPNVLENYPAIAAALGADVPMCLMNRPLRAQGIGEALAPVPHMPLLPVVLANTGRPVSTPDVFKALSHASGTPMPAMPPSFRSAQHAADWLSGHTRNDLQEAAMGLCPDIADTLAALSRSGAVFTRMSGSGATCFGLFETVEDAQDAATWLAAVETEWFVEATCLLPSPPLQEEDYPAWADWMKTARSLHSTSPS
ncbi:MAG: 4-(cytidine 5'-diphospho)-2-C-methyl-D-erythritol kinase, partial [Pseudomonadota bacterium]